MQVIEKFISPLIRDQFPEFYKDEGELFITFVKAYYEWLETSTQELELQRPDGFNVGDEVTQLEAKGKILFKEGRRIVVEVLNFDAFRCNINCDSLDELVSSSGAKTLILSQNRFNPIYWARRLPEIRDIDKTIDRFILQFKNKYLPNVQFVTATNKELFIKNALDFYRAKGTERAIDLFFKLVHGFEARVYYPGDDLFKPSDNEWADIKYLEISYAETNINLVGQPIFGASSGAEAFAEKLVRIKKDTRFINVLYITNLKGDFVTGEQIRTIGLEEDTTAKIVGSLSALEILPSSPGFVVGEDLIILEGQGKGAKVRVTETEDFVGAIDFELIDGGWGYGPNPDIIGSDRVLLLDNYTVSNTEYYFHFDTFKQFEKIQQDCASFIIDTDEEIPPLPAQVIGKDNSEQTVFQGIAVNFDEDAQKLIINYDTSDENNDDILDAEFLEFIDGEDALSINVDTNVTPYVFSVSANVIASSQTYRYTYEMANSELQLTPNRQLRRNDILSQDVFINGVERQVANVTVTEVSSNAQLNEFYADVVKGYGLFREGESFPPIVRKSTGDEYRIRRVSNTAIGVISVSGTSANSEDNILYTGGKIYGVSPYIDTNTINSLGISEIVYDRDGTEAILTGSFAGETPKAIFEITERDNFSEDVVLQGNIQLTYSGANVVSFFLDDIPYILDDGTALQDATTPIGVKAEDNGDIIFEGTAIEYDETTQRLIVSYNNIVYPNTAFVENLSQLIFDDPSELTVDVVSANHQYSSILNTVVGSEEYGILPNPSLGFNDSIFQAGDFSNIAVSSLSFIVPLIAGRGYPIDPFYIVYEPNTFHLEKYDVAIKYEENNKSFLEGEIIDVLNIVGSVSELTVPPERYRIFRHDRINKVIEARRLSLDDDLWISNSVRKGQIIRGDRSSVSATVSYVKELRRSPRIGLNANIRSTAFSGGGVIRNVSIVSSGFGYFDEERLLFVSEKDQSKRLAAIGKLRNQGIGEGFSKNRKSFLSSDKYLQDNDFYQEYSYQVLTALPFSTYKQTLIDVIHVAGTKPFGQYVATLNNELEIVADSDSEQANSDFFEESENTA